VLEPVIQRRLPEVISERILAAIREGAFAPGERLPPEHELARQLGVGRTSVREALQKLQTLGVVTVMKGRGAFVAEGRSDAAQAVFARWIAEHRFEIKHLVEVRIALESAAAGLAAVRATKAQVLTAERRSRAHLAAAATRGDIDEVVRSDVRFHEAIMIASRNDILATIYGMLAAELAEFRHGTLSLPGAPERSAKGHAAIVEALRARDPAAARAAAVSHLWVLYEEVHAGAGADGRRNDRRTGLVAREAFDGAGR